jgi:hypothetical protein
MTSAHPQQLAMAFDIRTLEVSNKNVCKSSAKLTTTCWALKLLLLLLLDVVEDHDD